MQTKREKAIAIALKNNIKSHINKKQDTAIKYYNVGDNYVKLKNHSINIFIFNTNFSG